MAFVPAIGTALGATANATLVGASVLTGVASTAITTISNVRAGNVQAAILARNAKLAEANADAQRAASRVQAQDQDFEAAAIIEGEIAQQGGSGFSINSGSNKNRIRTLRVLATRDRLRTINDGENRARTLENQATGLNIEAGQAKPSFLDTVVGGGLGIANSLISGANLSSTLNQRKLQRSTVTA